MSAKDVENVRTYPSPPPQDGVVEVDAIGLLCPLPVLKLQKALRQTGPQMRVLLRATDPASRIDVPHFCNETGHHLLETHTDGDVFSYLVRMRA